MSRSERTAVVKDRCKRLLELVCDACWVLTEFLYAFEFRDLGVYERDLKRLRDELCRACSEG